MKRIQPRPEGLEAKPPSPIRVKYCLYARKSTEQEDKQVLSIDSQVKEIEKMVATEHLEIVVTKKESHSVKEVGQRPVFNEIGMKERVKTEIERHKRFQSSLLGEKPATIKTADIDIRNYAKYILRDGGIWEKRELLSCLKSKLVMNNKVVRIIE